MVRFNVMSRLGLAEPLVRLARAVERSNRAAATRRPVAQRQLRRRVERPA
jgi:hypothetical protein